MIFFLSGGLGDNSRTGFHFNAARYTFTYVHILKYVRRYMNELRNSITTLTAPSYGARDFFKAGS